MSALELLVVGAGPAGVSAALWARTFGLACRVIEGDASPGGQLHHVHFHPAEVPAWLDGDGPELSRRMARQLAEGGVDARYDCVAVGFEPAESDGRPAVRLASGERWEAEAVLVASGARRRRLGVPGEREFEGHGVSFSATRDRAALAGKRVAVVGGGDAAYENALKLADAGCAVALFVREHPRARREFQRRVAGERRIEVREQSRVLAILGDDAVRGVRIAGPFGTLEQELEAVVVKVGAVPNTEWCRGPIEADAEGYLLTDATGATSAASVWAAGDVTRPLLPSVGVAIGQAATAVACIRRALRDER